MSLEAALGTGHRYVEQRGAPSDRGVFLRPPINAAYGFRISGHPDFKILGVNGERLLGYGGPCVPCGPQSAQPAPCEPRDF
jgi:hypothetical protein